MIDCSMQDYKENMKNVLELTNYPRKREFQIAAERKREIEIFQKVLTKTK